MERLPIDLELMEVAYHWGTTPVKPQLASYRSRRVSQPPVSAMISSLPSLPAVLSTVPLPRSSTRVIGRPSRSLAGLAGYNCFGPRKPLYGWRVSYRVSSHTLANFVFCLA